MSSWTGKKIKEKEFRQRFFVSVIAMAVILALTVVALTQISANGEEHAFANIKEAAEISDRRMASLVDDTFRALDSLASLVASETEREDLISAGNSIAGTKIGPLGMETRVYLPDGRAVTGAGIKEDVTAFMNYAETASAMQNGRYISCVKPDPADAAARVMEFFVPLRKDGQTVAIISAVMDLTALPEFMASASFDGQSDVLFLDTRDGTFFVDSYHGSITDIGDYTGRKDKDGNSVIPFFENMMSHRETYTTLISKRTGDILYIYAVPSQIEGWNSVIVIDEQIAFRESITAGRTLYMLAAGEVLICLLYIIWMYYSAKSSALAGSRELLNRMAAEDGLFLIDCARDTRKTIHDHCAGADNYSDADSYSDSIEKYIGNCVAETDRRMMRKVTSTAYMLERLKTEKEYTVEYRDISTDIQRFYKMRIVKFSDTEVLQSFAEKDREVFNRLIAEKLEAEYFALLTVDVDSGLLQVLKNGPWQGTEEVGRVEPYTPSVRKLARALEGDSRLFFEKMSDLNYLKKTFEKEDKATHIFRSYLSGAYSWCNVTGLVLARQQDGEPSLIALCFNVLDKDMTEKIDLQQRLEASMNVVGGLASEYTALYHVNLDTGAYTSYQFSAKNDAGEPLYGEYGTFPELVAAFAGSEMVYPEHRESLRAFYASDAAVRRALSGKKKASLLFRQKYGEEYLWTEADIIKCEDTEKEAHSVIVGTIEKDAEVRREQEARAHQKEAEEAGKLIENITSRYNIVYTVDMATDMMEIRRMDDSMIETAGQFRSFSEAREFTLTEVIHPRDRERMRSELSFTTIRQKLSQTPSYDITYCIIKNSTTMWGKLKVTAIGDNKIIIAMSEKDIEVPKHIMEEMRYNEYFSLFFVDLDTGMIREIRNTSGQENMGGKTNAPYTPAIRAYAATLEGDERGFFMKLSDPEYVRQEFAEDDKRTYTYKSRLTDSWIEAVSYVIERHADGTPAMLSLGFIYIDSLSAERQEAQTQIRTDMEMIGCLGSGFMTLYHAEIDAGILRVYVLDGQKLPETKQIVSEGGDPFETLHRYGRSELVHPDDRYLFEEITAEGVREKLAHTKSFRIRFRRKFGEEYLWSEMVAVKNENTDERANAIAIGFVECDAAIRREMSEQN